MSLLEYTFSGKKVQYFLDSSFSALEDIVPKKNTIVITDENVFKSISQLGTYPCVVIPAGEQHKNIATVDYIIRELIRLEADRSTFIIGVGGGVVTDITGFAASVYMRGIRFGFVPTTILAQVDASIGGKNGVDTGLYKNLVGTIRQPDFILFDYSLLQTLSREQWINGFAEIIKHGCIKDLSLFEMLEKHDIEDFISDKNLLAPLIERNVVIKSNVVEQDEFEHGDRKLLNFGHTIGHAIENLYELPHGHAISIGMAYACGISERLNGFQPGDSERVIRLLHQYQLPTKYAADPGNVYTILKMDKKRVRAEINFVLLNKIGEAAIRAIPLERLEAFIA